MPEGEMSEDAHKMTHLLSAETLQVELWKTRVPAPMEDLQERVEALCFWLLALQV